MVDLSTCKTAMRTKKTKRRWNDPEIFYVARHRAGLDVAQAAQMLNVTTKTLRNWENGSSSIPYAAFRLMRLFGGHSLVDKAWEGWSLSKGVLYSPVGRAFEPYQLTYLSNYLWMARQWLKEREAASAATASAAKNQTFSTAKLEALASEAPSCATAQSGARGLQGLHSLFATDASLQGKNLTAVKLGNYREFQGIAEAANDMIHSEVQ